MIVFLFNFFFINEKIKSFFLNRYSGYNFGMLYMYYSNETLKNTLVEKVFMSKLIGLEICHPFTSLIYFYI